MNLSKRLNICMLLALFGGTLMFAQNWETVLSGRIDDLRRLPLQTPQGHEFTFVRLIFNGRVEGYMKNWYTDYPTGDRHLIRVLSRLMSIDLAPEPRAIPPTHPDLFSYPMIYSSEPGQMMLDPTEARMMREYVQRGGFWMLDDFWGTFEWDNFEREMAKVFPEHQIVDVPLDHPIFHNFYEISEKLQVPNVNYAYCHGCPTHELDGYETQVRGVFDNTGRLGVLINFNTDLMDASEWSDDPRYPHRFSAYSYKVFSNAVLYAMTH